MEGRWEVKQHVHWMLYSKRFRSISDLFQKTGGIHGSICSNDYGPALSEIGESVLDLVQTISLKAEPVDGSVSVEFSPAQSDVKWSVEGLSIVFSQPPQAGTKITVNYLPKK